MGVLDLLDEECRLPSGTDSSYVNKLYKQFSTPPNPHAYFAKPRFSNEAFTINHYAHSVVYDVDGFLDKNKDTLPEEILTLLQESSFDFAKELFEKPTSSSTESLDGKSGGSQSSVSNYGSSARRLQTKPTLGSAFKQSLQKLMETINSTNVHYIRCVKPNELKKPFYFENVYVLQQLRACGVLETIRISCAGYPSRFGFSEFTDRYRLLVKNIEGKKDTKDTALAILQTVIKADDQFQVGLTKIFLRAGQVYR